MSKYKRRFTVADVHDALLEQSESDSSSDESIAEAEAENADDSSDGDSEVVVARKRARVIVSSSEEEESELEPVPQNSNVATKLKRVLQVPWVWNYCDGDSYNPPNIVFTGNEEILADLPEECRPIDFFATYMTPDIIQHIVAETNRYAQQ